MFITGWGTKLYMTGTASTRLRGGEPRAASPYRRQRLSAVATGIAIGVGCTAVAAAAVGAGLYVAASDELFANVPSKITAPAVTMIAKTLTAIEARFPAANSLAAAMHRPDTTADTDNPTLAFAIPVSAQIAPPETPAAPPKLSSVALYNSKAGNDAKPQLRGGVQLASLTPSDELKLTPQGDVSDARTAIYDISGQVVYMPNGEKLEAHSGLGDFMDDPRLVHVRRRGATPPNTYRLTMRESRFHGIEAIRMTPENDDAMYQRNGILAHPYMLGPSGESNGCISFKDYGKFLAAFKRGEVDRIVVVARLDKPPASYVQAHPLAASPWTAWLPKMFGG
jgi:hypothetical protein